MSAGTEADGSEGPFLLNPATNLAEAGVAAAIEAAFGRDAWEHAMQVATSGSYDTNNGALFAKVCAVLDACGASYLVGSDRFFKFTLRLADRQAPIVFRRENVLARK